MELELGFSGVVQPVIILPGSFQQRVRADDVRLNELARTVDRTIHMAFRSEVHHMRRFELCKHPIKLILVADVDLLELEPVGLRDRREIFRIARIGELIDHAYGIRRVVDDVPGHCRPDESGSAGHDDTVHNDDNFLIIFWNLE